MVWGCFAGDTDSDLYYNSFKNVVKAFQVKQVERITRVCKAVLKAKDGYFEESQI